MRRICWLILLAIAATVQSAAAADVRSGAVAVKDAWARATTPAAKAGGAFMTIANTGAAGDRLVSAKAEVADRTELHATVEADGVMKMREVEGGIALPSGGVVEFRPGGYHVMLMGLKRPLKVGEQVPLTLTFEKAGSIQVAIEVKAANHSQANDPHGKHRTH